MIPKLALVAVFTLFTLFAAAAGEETPDAVDRPSVVIVVGAEGTSEYGDDFRRWADLWANAAGRAGAAPVRIGPGQSETSTTDLESLREVLEAEAHDGAEALWLVLIGHGTFDGRQAKFNLRGPDVTASALAEWLKPFERPTAIVNCSSSSGPFINRLSAPNRVVVTATKSGFEYNYSRFGGELARSIDDETTDLDKDGQTSLLEAFLAASARTAEFYAQDGRLATEHALVDDNGDGRGTPATWFRGVRVIREAKDKASPDGLRANQFVLLRTGSDRGLPAEVRARRDELEAKIESLRQRKSQFESEDDYYDLLQPLFVELARLYEGVEKDQR